eukprot:CAMPEP_0119042724 /NCGR_PEP_ID=MMETSP1177-20130426/16111_1 /TAXON_ID=2985 /ORGANISM="Ochromonas sp, Strain CCMP1899" /LENGTH=210 /DNA_ID=CAMNT_0007009709 /DNA_START=312 /DNA_END=944 /DNA_ORIENTATION=-
MTVWMDISDDSTVIPLFEGFIFLKISRVSDVAERRIEQQKPTIQPQRQQEQPTVQRNNVPREINKPPVTVINKPPATTESLLAFSNDDHDSFMDSNDLIGMDNGPSQPISKTSSDMDLFGIDSLQPTPMQPSKSQNIDSLYSSPGSTGYSSTSGTGPQGNSGNGMNMMNQNQARVSPQNANMDAFSGLNMGAQSNGIRPPNQQQSQRRPY